MRQGNYFSIITIMMLLSTHKINYNTILFSMSDLTAWYTTLEGRYNHLLDIDKLLLCYTDLH